MRLTTGLSTINLLAVIAAGLAHMATGLVWYQPKLFGNAWAELTSAELKPAPRWIPAGVVGHQVIALVLAVVVKLANATTALGGLAVGVLMCLGFVVTLEVGELIWEKIPFRLFMIRIGNHLVALGIAGTILAGWRRRAQPSAV
jgi:hypothetical protein